ncbi:MAG: hypothetical protein AAFY53_02540 [Pseudomonadota bacterium]
MSKRNTKGLWRAEHILNLIPGAGPQWSQNRRANLTDGQPPSTAYARDETEIEWLNLPQPHRHAGL